MKKAMTIGLVAVLAAGTAVAENGMVGQMGGSSASEVLVTAEAALVSSYVWRGQVQNNDFVVQPQITASQYGVSLNVWGNYDLGKNYLGVSSDFSEIDISLAYTLPLDLNDVTFDFGIIGYTYPANGSNPAVASPLGINKQSTTELFAKATVLSLRDYVIPSVAIFGDVDEASGVYMLFDIVAPYKISDFLWVEGGFSAGWGNTSYNDYHWGASLDSGWNDYNFYGSASYEILENLTAAVNLTYTLVEGGALGDAANNLYENDQKFWGGVNIAYDF